MKIVKQSSSVISGLKPLEHIEKIGRICYKSEDKIMEGTANKFVKMLFGNKHHAMLEHYRFIVQVKEQLYDELYHMKLDHMEFTSYNDRLLISFNARTLIDIGSYDNQAGYTIQYVKSVRDMLISFILHAYDCYELFGIDHDQEVKYITDQILTLIPNSHNCMSHDEYRIHGWKSIHFITDRGISHEIVRHREETSFAQESTRYCNYGTEKFGGEIVVLDQGFVKGTNEFEYWMASCEESEYNYFNLLSAGILPQMARSVLPTCLKTEIVVTAPIYEWEHIINTRYYGKTGKPHPLMVELMEPVSKEVFWI